MTIVEDYSKGDLDVELEQLVREEEERELDRMILLESAGFTQQPVRSLLRVEACYPMLSDEDIDIWREFLPTRYSDKVRFLRHGEAQPWSSYSFDTVPEEALRAIAMAKQTKLFDRLEIWTPEIPQPVRHTFDPMVVGVVRDGPNEFYFQIVRWGESLLSFSRISEIVAWRQHYIRAYWRRRRAGFVFLCLMTVAGLVLGGIANPNSLILTMPFSPLALVGLGVFLLGDNRYRATRLAWAKHPAIV